MSGRHLLAVLESVMELSHLSAATVRLQTRTVPVAAVIEESVQMVLHSAETREHTIEVESAPGLFVDADHDRLRQVLLNLLGNAVKYTPRRGSIRVPAWVMEREGRSCAAVSLSDTGPGIPPDQREAVFEPNTRLSRTDGQPASGLGLAICRELVRHPGGHIDLESELGHGSTFTVRLPLPAAAPVR